MKRTLIASFVAVAALAACDRPASTTTGTASPGASAPAAAPAPPPASAASGTASSTSAAPPTSEGATASASASASGASPATASASATPGTAAMGAGPAGPASGAASAQAAASPAPVLAPTQVALLAPPANEDVSAGRGIAMQGANGAAACMGCHGQNGEGNAQAGFPRLAGLGRMYIERQLNSYADGTRQHPVMTPIAGNLSAQQRMQVAAFYAGLSTPSTESASAGGGNPPVLVVRGDDKRGLQACVNCHGPQGIGDAGANPYLAGQHQAYLVSALGEWKDGSRHNDPSGQMPAIAKALTDADTKQLAAYFAGLPAPAPRNAQAAAVAVNTSRPAVQSGPSGPTAPAQGKGTEQGAPVMGGSQGPAAGGAATNPAQTTTR